MPPASRTLAHRIDMNTHLSILLSRLRLAAACCLLSGATAAVAGGAQVPHLLDVPAHVSRHTAAALIVAVSNAGGRLVAVGERGTVLLSDDQGRSWRQAGSVPVSVALTGVQFISAEQGWAIGHGGVVLHTADGGETWARQLDGRRIGALAAEEASSIEAQGGDATHLKRDAALLEQDGPDKPLLGLYFADAARGWAVGAYGIALATRDGGASWQAIMGRIPNAGGRHLYAISPTSEGLLIAGEQGRLFESRDGGERFEQLASDYEGTWFGALPLGGGRILAFGLRGNAWRHDGAGWQRIELGQAATLTAGLKLGDGRPLLVDEGGRVFRVAADGSRAELLGTAPVPGVSGVALAADGALLLASMRGPYRFEPNGASQ